MLCEALLSCTWSLVHGMIFTLKMFLRWPVRNLRSLFPEAASKMQTIVSSEPEAIRVPESFQQSLFTHPAVVVYGKNKESTTWLEYLLNHVPTYGSRRLGFNFTRLGFNASRLFLFL